MSTKGAAFLRARRPEHKRQRYDAILDAARELATAGSVGAVSLADIAERVGMHKSALLRYFETREEIFLQLAEIEWREWSEALVAALADEAAPGRVPEILGQSLSDRPLFCQLLLYAPLTLERNVSLDVVRGFKQAAMGAVDDVAGALHRALPVLGRDASFELLVMTGLVASGLWQAANPPPAVLAVQLELACTGAASRAPEISDFPDAVARFVRVYLAGLCAD